MSKMSGVYGSLGQPQSSKPDIPGSTPGMPARTAVLVFIKNLINN